MSLPIFPYICLEREAVKTFDVKGRFLDFRGIDTVGVSVDERMKGFLACYGLIGTIRPQTKAKSSWYYKRLLDMGYNQISAGTARWQPRTGYSRPNE